MGQALSNSNASELLQGKTGKGTEWSWVYTDSSDAEDHDTSRTLTFGGLVIKMKSESGRDVARETRSATYKGNLLASYQMTSTRDGNAAANGAVSDGS